MTARMANHPDLDHRTPEVLERLVSSGVDVEHVGPDRFVGRPPEDALRSLREGTVDLVLVGIGALRGRESEGLTTVAVLPRQEVRDVLVTLSGRATPLGQLGRGARVGVSGERRAAFLAAHRGDVETVRMDDASLRRVVTAERATDADEVAELDAVVMSALDARQVGLVDSTVEALDARAWLPEPGQGAFALVARHPIAEATALDHLPTRTALRAELALLDALGVSHRDTVGCLAQPSGRWIRLWAAAASPDGRRLVRSDRTGPLDEPEGLGSAVARELEARGFGLVVADVAG